MDENIADKQRGWHLALRNLIDGAATMKSLLMQAKKKSEEDVEEERSSRPRVHRSVEKINRERNLMVFGYWSHKRNYSKEVVDTLDYLGVDPKIENLQVVRNKALSPDGKVILRLSFGSDQPVTEALAAAKKLKSYKHKVFLAKDLNYAERVEQRCLVNKLKDKIKQDPQYHWAIEDSEIVNFGLRRNRAVIVAENEPCSESEKSDISAPGTVYAPVCKPVYAPVLYAPETVYEIDSDYNITVVDTAGPGCSMRSDSICSESDDDDNEDSEGLKRTYKSIYSDVGVGLEGPTSSTSESDADPFDADGVDRIVDKVVDNRRADAQNNKKL